MRLSHFKTTFSKKLERTIKKLKVSAMYTLHSPSQSSFLKERVHLIKSMSIEMIKNITATNIWVGKKIR